MAELNLKQITDKLNTEFAGEVRKLVFRYDANAEFAEDVDTLDLVNAKVCSRVRYQCGMVFDTGRIHFHINIVLDEGIKIDYEKVRTRIRG